jgi:hypothetical protein
MSHKDTNDLDEIVVEIMYGKFEGARTINMGKVKAAKQQLLTWIESVIGDNEPVSNKGTGGNKPNYKFIVCRNNFRRKLKQSFGIERKS